MVAGLAAAGLAPAWARGAAESEAAEDLAGILARSGLGRVTGCAVADVATGAVLEAQRPELESPPASVAKIVTALYGLARLGQDFRFETRVLATAPVAGGRVGGDLVLAGSGNPVLDTDALGDLVAALRAAGVARVSGRFLVATGALPEIAEIDPGQPGHAAYNASICGLNLNFNRVRFAWGPGAAGPDLTFSTPGARFAPRVAGIAAELGEGDGPFEHRLEPEGERWRVPRARLPGRGSVWLPVRAPARHAANLFAALAGAAGLDLPEAELVAEAPAGQVLAAHASLPLVAILRGMLFHSTNLTAEVVGLTATAQAQGGRAPESLRASAAAMTRWARDRFGLAGADFRDHSGLGDRSRVTAAGMARLLVRAHRATGLPWMLRERTLLDAAGRPISGEARLAAKTGTLNFASGLAGYLEGGRRTLAFAIFAADLAARERYPAREIEEPPGARSWTARARGQE